MKKISKVLNVLSTIFCIVMIVSVFAFNIFINGVYFNGYVALILLCMFLNPIANLCRINKKLIINPIYHLIVILVSSYASYIAINSLLIYKNNLNGTSDNFEALNLAGNYFGDKFLYILIAILLSVIITFLFKKEKIKSNKDNGVIMMILILVTSIVPFFTNMVTMEMVWTLSLIVFLIITFIRTRGIATASELQKYYLILIILSALSINPIALVLSIYMFLQLDTFGIII
jgi:hypothetical protein